MLNCPCGSELGYESCCGIYIDGTRAAPTPETLMRSRYTAYSLANIAYIKKTMRGKPFVGFDEHEAKRWALKVRWIGLRIISATEERNDLGHVEFIARFIEGDKLKSIHESSEFHGERGVWFYVDGVLQPTTFQPLQRNAPCPCGSLKKYKNCHALL